MIGSKLQHEIIEIGMPGKFDPVFGLIKYVSGVWGRDVYEIVWKDTGKPVVCALTFFNPLEAEHYVKELRETWIQRKIEDILL